MLRTALLIAALSRRGSRSPTPSSAPSRPPRSASGTNSLGGLFALYAMAQRPGLFQRIVAASPAKLNENREMFAAFDRLKASSAQIRLDISKGDEEPFIESVAAFVKALEEAKLANVELRSAIYRGENHNSVRLVWCPRSNLKKFRMDFDPRQGARRVKAGSLRGMPRAGLNARNLLRAGAEGHSRAMATTSNAAFGSKDAEIIQGNFGTPH